MDFNRVHIVRCENYDYQLVRRVVQEAVEAIGGLPVRAGDKVLLKPNLLAPKTPDKAVTTHPSVISAVAEMVLDCAGVPLIGDSPSGSPGEAIWRVTGMADAAERLNLEQADFNASRTTEAEVRGNIYYLALPAVECDVLINLPKLKTHSLTMFTGAVKNLYGCLPGFQKGNWHRRAPKNEQFSQVVVDVFSRFRPRVNIMDAVLAMEGEGPSNGHPRHLGAIIASDNAPALDRVSARLIDFGDEEILTTRYAELRGFTLNADKLVLSGASMEEITPAEFALPKDRYLRMIPHLAHEILGQFIWTRPEVDKSACTECGECVANCPSRAMTMNGAPPTIDHKICINCYCCDEVCPAAAINKKMSWLAKKLI